MDRHGPINNYQSVKSQKTNTKNRTEHNEDDLCYEKGQCKTAKKNTRNI